MLCFIDDRLVSTSAHKKEETRERDKERINRIGRDDHRGIQFDSNPKTQQQTLVVVYVVVVVVIKKAREEENKRRAKTKKNETAHLSFRGGCGAPHYLFM